MKTLKNLSKWNQTKKKKSMDKAINIWIKAVSNTSRFTEACTEGVKQFNNLTINQKGKNNLFNFKFYYTLWNKVYYTTSLD